MSKATTILAATIAAFGVAGPLSSESSFAQDATTRVPGGRGMTVIISPGGGGGSATGGPVIYAQTSKNCKGGGSFSISTGNDKGVCEAKIDSNTNNVIGGKCSDGAGNESEINCKLNGNQGACTGTKGAGTCN